jgi:hypothetical protein
MCTAMSLLSPTPSTPKWPLTANGRPTSNSERTDKTKPSPATSAGGYGAAKSTRPDITTSTPAATAAVTVRPGSRAATSHTMRSSAKPAAGAQKDARSHPVSRHSASPIATEAARITAAAA